MSLELGLLEQELGAAEAWSCWSRGAVVGTGARPTWDPGKHLSSFLLLWSYTATHFKKKEKRTLSLPSSSYFVALYRCWSSATLVAVNSLWSKKSMMSISKNQLLVEGHSELTTTNALVGHFVHWMGCIFSFGAGWGSSQSISFCC